MSTPLRLRAGIDPLVDPSDIADLAAGLMSPRDRLLVFLVDHRLVGSLSVAVDLDHDCIADLFTLVHHATLGTDLRGLVLAERTPCPLDFSGSIVSEVLAAPRHGLRVDAWVRFGPTSAYDVWPLLGPDATA